MIEIRNHNQFIEKEKGRNNVVEKEAQTPEEVIAQLKADMEAKYKKEREALAQKKKEERNALRRMERKLKKEEQDKLGKVIYDKYGIKSVVVLENEYEVVKKGESAHVVQEQAIPSGMVLVPEGKMAMIQSFYKETGEWCLQKQRDGGLNDTSVPNRVANFFREFYDIK